MPLAAGTSAAADDYSLTPRDEKRACAYSAGKHAAAACQKHGLSAHISSSLAQCASPQGGRPSCSHKATVMLREGHSRYTARATADFGAQVWRKIKCQLQRQIDGRRISSLALRNLTRHTLDTPVIKISAHAAHRIEHFSATPMPAGRYIEAAFSYGDCFTPAYNSSQPPGRRWLRVASIYFLRRRLRFYRATRAACVISAQQSKNNA